MCGAQRNMPKCMLAPERWVFSTCQQETIDTVSNIKGDKKLIWYSIEEHGCPSRSHHLLVHLNPHPQMLPVGGTTVS